MLLPAPLAFGDVAGKQYDNRMQVWTGEPSHPMIWMISSCGAEDARPGRHALTKLFREGGQGCVIHTEHLQTVPGEANGHPPCVKQAGHDNACGAHLVDEARQPCSSL